MSAIKNARKLVEARPREFKSDREKKLKRRLINLLRDDGKGHHHAKYAERLEKFDIQIVPLSVDEEFTAAISFDRGIIFIGEGFLTDPGTFFQLNVLLRHELAHNLLMHQIRMAYKVGEATHIHTGLSDSLHNLYNIICDDEISNRKYSAEDKIIVRNMMLNGKHIGGLVTEDHRKDWITMSIEEMYDQICIEIEEIQEQLRRGLKLTDIARERPDGISQEILKTYIYSDIASDSMIPGSLKAFIDRGCSIGGDRWRASYREIAEQIFNILDGKLVSEDELKALLTKIAESSPVQTVDLFEDDKVKLYTPEQKYAAVEVLKKFKSEYTEWYDKILSSLDELDTHELQELLDMLK